MAGNLSFNTKGSVPSLSSYLPTSSNSSYGGTPFNKALNTMSSGSTPAIPLMKPNEPTKVAYGESPMVPSGQYSNTPQLVQGSNPGLIPPKGQDVKSHTVTNVDGSTVSQTYHPTPQPLADQTTPGLLNPNAKMQEVNGGSPGTPAPQSQNSQSPTYPGLIGQIQQGASQPSQAYTDAVNKAQDVNHQLAQSRLNEAQGLANNANNPIPLEFQQGRAQVMQNQYTQQQNALAGEYQGASNLVGAANTQQGLNQSGLLGAAGLAQPQLAGFNQQSFNPLTGQFGSGGQSGSLPLEAQNAVNTYAQQVKSGQMTRADAESRLSAYGVAGTNALTQALGQDFNTNASNASAGTTQQGQQLQTAASATNQALATLQTLYNGLPSTSSTSIPGINGVSNSINSLLGSSALTTYKQTLADARAQLQGVLTASGAATPTGAESAALTYLPDNMSPDQLKQAISNVQQLIQQKVASFTQSGQQNNATTNSGANLYSF